MDITLDTWDIVDGVVQVVGSKTLYRPSKRASEWVREEIKGVKCVDAPQLSSYYGIKPEGRCGLVPGAIGYMHNNGNNVYHNGTLVGLYSSAFAAAHGLSIIPSNLRKVVALFTARKTIKRNWINDKDEYMPPNITNKDQAQ